jgi:hypothetical protein
LAGFVAKTTCLIPDGRGVSKSVIEFSYLEAYQLSMPEKLGMQLVKVGNRAREYRVSTLPLTLQRVQNRKQERLSVFSQVDLFPE